MTDLRGRVVPLGVGEKLPFIGSLRLSAADTGGAFEAMEYSGPETPPPHVHRDHDELFYILEGSFKFVLGHDTVQAPKGALVFVPRGTRHGFSIEPGSKTLFLTIPAGLEGFFKELGNGLSSGKPTAEVRAGLAGKYDSHPAKD